MQTEKNTNKRIFLIPGKTNDEDRQNFIYFWVHYMKEHSDDEWSKQQNNLINSVIPDTKIKSKKSNRKI